MNYGYTKESRNIENINDYPGISFNTDVSCFRICCM